jgi:putative FmdB family regulatory protein
MPLYEYRCSKCEQIFEVIQKFSDAPLTEHEGCGGYVERLLSPPAFQFKGSGWYITDYSRSGGEKAEKNGSGTDAGSAKTAEKASDSKSETNTEAKAESKPAASPSKTD